MMNRARSCASAVFRALASRPEVVVAGIGAAAAAAVRGVAKSSPVGSWVSRPIIFAALGVAVAATVRALWTRYVTLRSINNTINPAAMMNIDMSDRPMYNWRVGEQGYITASQIRAHYADAGREFINACSAGRVDIYRYEPGVNQYGPGARRNKIRPGDTFDKPDILRSIEHELGQLRSWMQSIESCADLSFMGIHFFGARKNFAQACQEQGITGLSLLNQRLTDAQEIGIDARMTQERGLHERAVALFMANPNYDKAHSLFWNLDQRIGRLEAIKQAVASAVMPQRLPLVIAR
jgi:hypothetical protein